MESVQRELGSIESQLEAMNGRMADGFGAIQRSLSQISEQFRSVDQRIDEMERRLATESREMDKRVSSLETSRQVTSGQLGISLKLLTLVGGALGFVIATAVAGGQLIAQFFGRAHP